MDSKSTAVVSAFVTCAFICFVFYQTIGNARLFIPNYEFGDNSTRATTFSAETNVSDNRIELFEKRRSDVIEICKKINRMVSNSSALNREHILFEKKHFIYYCPIAKVGSTFWKRVLTVMASQGILKSPFEITLRQVYLPTLKKNSNLEYRILEERGTSFMFVRDPYARLFSGYENKIYQPNLSFWKSIGSHVVRIVRKEAAYKKYGFDVTFPEFIKYILHLKQFGKTINGHFSPMIDHCDPCSFPFQYIGKLETIREDAIYLISKWRREFNDFNLHFDDFERETILDTARGHIRFLFQAKKVAKEINFPPIKLMLRTWRDLQIRGHLSKYIDFPFNDTDVEKITKDDYMEAVREALNIPVNRTEVKNQRDEALAQAYRQVPIEDMEKLRKYLLMDCLLFGYDDRPQQLFDRSKPLNGNFVYLDGLKKY